MSKEQVIIDIAPDGAVSVTAQGIKGAACKDATRQIEAALGKVTADKPTDELYQTAGRGVTLKRS